MTWTPVRLAKDCAVAIGIVTAIVGFVKLLVSGWSAFPDLLYWAGIAYGVLALVMSLWCVVRPPEPSLRWWALAAVVCWPFLVLVFAASPTRWPLQAVGVLGLFWAATTGAMEYEDWRRYERQVPKICPDCAEEVKAEARVCKHCGYRFAPKVLGE
jgi:hypothetical protein